MKKMFWIIMIGLMILFGAMINQSEAGRRFGRYYKPYFGSWSKPYFGSWDHKYPLRPYNYDYVFPSEEYRPYGYCFPYYGNNDISPYDKLKNVKPAGNLTIFTTTPGAQVYVDGWPLTKENDFTYSIGLLTGLHQVEVKADGYEPYSELAELRAGANTNLSITLKKK